MLVSNFIIGNATFKLAVNDGAIFVKGEQKATFNGVYCCSNTWRHCGEVDEGANVIRVNKDGNKHKLFFTFTNYKNVAGALPITNLVLCNLDGGHSPEFPFISE